MPDLTSPLPITADDIIREKAWARDRLIVAATGWGQEEDRRRSKEAGFDFRLVKPVDADELNRLLAERKS